MFPFLPNEMCKVVYKLQRVTTHLSTPPHPAFGSAKKEWGQSQLREISRKFILGTSFLLGEAQTLLISLQNGGNGLVRKALLSWARNKWTISFPDLNRAFGRCWLHRTGVQQQWNCQGQVRCSHCDHKWPEFRGITKSWMLDTKGRKMTKEDRGNRQEHMWGIYTLGVLGRQTKPQKHWLAI